MKHKKTFIVILAAVIFLAGCSNGTTDSGLSKTTSLTDEIPLKGKYYTEQQAESLLHWNGGWEFDPSQKQLKLSNLMPGGEIKNDTSYEVTISGTSNKPIDRFQFVFTVPGFYDTDKWIDLSEVPLPMAVPAGKFSITKTLKTKGIAVPAKPGEPADPLTGKPADIYVKDYSNSGMLAFTNDVDTFEDEHNLTMATLTDVTITITEK